MSSLWHISDTLSGKDVPSFLSQTSSVDDMRGCEKLEATIQSVECVERVCITRERRGRERREDRERCEV